MANPKFAIGQSVITPMGQQGRIEAYDTWNSSITGELLYAYMVSVPHLETVRMHGSELFITMDEFRAWRKAQYERVENEVCEEMRKERQ